MLSILVRLHVLALSLDASLDTSVQQRRRDQRGQTTAEYALVLLGAATVALLLTLWAKQSGKLGKLLDAIFDNLISMVKN
jgi:Flp pilus assembly pilin Flp